VAAEFSEGGSRIYRHEAKDSDELDFATGDGALIEAVDDHLDRLFGSEDRSVFHEIVSTTVHVDVHFVPPSDDRPFIRLVTSGMAQAPMTVPDEWDEAERHAELTIALPPDWQLSQEAFEDERWYWPVRLLKMLARVPHEYDTFLWHGHTIPNGDPPEPYAPGTELCCALVIPPLEAPEGFDVLEVPDGRRVRVLGVLPIYEDEMSLKLKRGADDLYALLYEHGIADVVDPQRPSVAAGRKRRGVFRR
jgi:hypothetical protein